MKKSSKKAKSVKKQVKVKPTTKKTKLATLSGPTSPLDEVVADSITEVYDEAELADMVQQKFLNGAINNILNQLPDSSKESAKECVECGDKIPGARRKALPGVMHCVNCQSFLESRNKQRKATGGYTGE